MLLDWKRKNQYKIYLTSRVERRFHDTTRLYFTRERRNCFCKSLGGMTEAHSGLIVSMLVMAVYFKFWNRLQKLCWNIAKAAMKSILKIGSGPSDLCNEKNIHSAPMYDQDLDQSFVQKLKQKSSC